MCNQTSTLCISLGDYSNLKKYMEVNSTGAKYHAHWFDDYVQLDVDKTVGRAKGTSKGKVNNKPNKLTTAKKGSTAGNKRKKNPPSKGNTTTIRNRSKCKRARLSRKVSKKK